MMNDDSPFTIIKASGEQAAFSYGKLRASLKHTGAGDPLIEQIIRTVRNELYPGISTREIYNRAFAMLRKDTPVFASRYKLKKAIFELGPTGFPFEKFVGSVLQYSGYEKETGKVVPGTCVDHEIDVFARKNGIITLVECKFHSEQGRKCDVKIPLYIHSRFLDISSAWKKNYGNNLSEPWVVTNTRFTSDARKYGRCAGLYLLSWDHPEGDSLKERIDRLGLHPVTSSTLMTKREKQFLLDKGIVLCRDLCEEPFMLDHIGVSEKRKTRILEEIGQLCSSENYLREKKG
ncbi:restriction endonuclease [Sinomicrobium soli]|uniref:restriction endonuclease n=1 Tax=Sinomicrobium sp. N-1-3-6 TaxID=2219864 RepID=UPI000DCF0769|nr:restriction endonuclease [Sinomicrobium sp. N-1-3-6]RAV29166.1 ATPase [Sinomicrobium sp. N-1-3-6]